MVCINTIKRAALCSLSLSLFTIWRLILVLSVLEHKCHGAEVKYTITICSITIWATLWMRDGDVLVSGHSDTKSLFKSPHRSYLSFTKGNLNEIVNCSGQLCVCVRTRVPSWLYLLSYLLPFLSSSSDSLTKSGQSERSLLTADYDAVYWRVRTTLFRQPTVCQNTYCIFDCFIVQSLKILVIELVKGGK